MVRFPVCEAVTPWSNSTPHTPDIFRVPIEKWKSGSRNYSKSTKVLWSCQLKQTPRVVNGYGKSYCVS